jgi:anti-sigma B factor antagonist
VRTVERTALVRFADAEFLFEESAVRAVGEQLDRLITVEDQRRLVLNFRGVRYMSSDMLAALARLQKRVGPAGGRVRLCGLDPLLRQMVRVARLDGVLDVCTDEAEALGLLSR